MEVNAHAAAQIPAVAYLRRSTNRQERSLDDQRREIETYAGQHGYRISAGTPTAESAATPRSGDSSSSACIRRPPTAATSKSSSWDYSRFGRFDSIEAGRWIYPLRQAGVKLVTVAEGLVDWDCFARSEVPHWKDTATGSRAPSNVCAAGPAFASPSSH